MFNSVCKRLLSLKMNESRSITEALFIGLFFVRYSICLKGGEKMQHLVDIENPRVLYVMADRLEDQQLVYTNIQLVYLFIPLTERHLYEKGG